MDNKNIETSPVYNNYKDLFNSVPNLMEGYDGYTKYALELAGKDSIVACLKLIKERKGERLLILPISILHSGFTGSLWDATKISTNFAYLKRIVTKDDVVILNPIICDCSKAFNEIILRTMGIVQKKYSAFAPCVPCHLFFHMFRLPILKHFKITNLISGERVQHSKRIKLNQTREILEFFQSKLESLGINLIQPLMEIVDNQDIENIILESKANYEKLNGTEFNHKIIPDECIFSRSADDEHGNPVFEPSQILIELQEFYYPKMYSFLKDDLNLD